MSCFFRTFLTWNSGLAKRHPLGPVVSSTICMGFSTWPLSSNPFHAGWLLSSPTFPRDCRHETQEGSQRSNCKPCLLPMIGRHPLLGCTHYRWCSFSVLFGRPLHCPTFGREVCTNMLHAESTTTIKRKTRFILNGKRMMLFRLFSTQMIHLPQVRLWYYWVLERAQQAQR